MQFEEHITELKKKGEFFSREETVFIARAPGRLDLMGGNDDYTGGLVFESTIQEATYAVAQLRKDNNIEINNVTATAAGWQGQLSIPFDQLLNEAAVKEIASHSAGLRWTAYVIGNLFYLKRKFPLQVNAGVNLFIDSTVPLNRGVSSSAAVEVAVMKAAAAAYGINLSGVELSLACQWVENTIADSACGIMDQVAVVTGRKGFIMPLVCQPCNPEPLIQLPEDLQIWGIDSGVSHQVAGIEYEAARAAAFMGYKIICDAASFEVVPDTGSEIERYTDAEWNGYLANLSPAVFHLQYSRLLPAVLTKEAFLQQHAFHADPFTPLKEGVNYNVLANTKYAVEENQRVQLFSELSKGASLTASKRSYALMGELMYQSHQAYTECGLGAIATDKLVSIAGSFGIPNGIYGAKITGGGAGGTVAILADKNAGSTIAKIFDGYASLQLGEPYLFEGSSDGADHYGIHQVH